MVAPIFSGSAQSQHHLVPPPTFAQMLRQACQVTFRQSLELLHHLFTLVHRIETVHPKHNFHLDFQGQHTAKRLILGIHESSAVHDHRLQHELRSLYWVLLIHGVLEPITHSRQDIGVPPKKVYPWGAPPRVSSHDPTPPRDDSPPINAFPHVSKSRCVLCQPSFQFDQLSCSSW